MESCEKSDCINFSEWKEHKTGRTSFIVKNIRKDSHLFPDRDADSISSLNVCPVCKYFKVKLDLYRQV